MDIKMSKILYTSQFIQVFTTGFPQMALIMLVFFIKSIRF